MLLRKLLNMNLELYGHYPEFREVDVTLEQVVDAGMDEIRAINIIDGPRSRAIGKAYREAVAKAESRSLQQTARRMKAKGLNISLIAEITGLSEAEIKRLRKA